MKRSFEFLLIGLIVFTLCETGFAAQEIDKDIFTDKVVKGEEEPDYSNVNKPGRATVDSNIIHLFEIDGEFWYRYEGEVELKKARIDKGGVNFDEGAKLKSLQKLENSKPNINIGPSKFNDDDFKPKDLRHEYLNAVDPTDILFYEDFEGSFPGDTWDVGDQNPDSGEDYWDDVSCGNPWQGDRHVWCADIGDQSNCDTYDNNMDAHMRTSNWINIDDRDNLQWSFRIKWDLEVTGGIAYDSAAILITTGGSYWSVYDCIGQNPNWPNYNLMTVNINTSSNQMKIRYRMWSDYSITEEGVYVDDIVVTGDSQGPDIYTLEDDLYLSLSDDPGYFKYYQTSVYWAVVGVRSPSNTDLDLRLYDDEGYSNRLAISQTTDAVDFIVGDYNHNSRPQWDFPKAYFYSGSGTYRIEYENSADILFSGLNGPYNWPNNDVVEIWDVYLTLGEGYYFLLNIQGSADLGIALFKSNGETYYAGKSSSVAVSDNPGGNYDEAFIYYAPTSDWYGLVVWSNDGSSVDYYIEIDNSLAIEGDRQNVPSDFALLDNYPNPFNAQTMIEYALPKATHVTIEIYDLLGRKIKTLIEGSQQAGYHQATWNASDQASGLYFYKIHAGEFTETKKMTLLK